MSIMRRSRSNHRFFALVLLVCLFGTPIAGAQPQPPPIAGAQPPPLAPPPPPPGQALTPDQLDDLVAPIALYPDPLLSQVLVACTYPLEVVQAYQFVQKSPGLTGPALTQAAQQQNWDPSVQALVMFPDVLKRLNDDITWTTNLGNAFLSQQQDVMNAIQTMRQQAEQAGRLQSTPQQTVTTTTNAGPPIIVIQPANPNVIYVPVYDPVWIWGPPRWYPYPQWVWPPRTVLTAGLFFGFGAAINVGLFFGGGWHGWSGWGWHPGWANHTVSVNNVFIHQYNFNTVHINNVHSTTVWTHDPVHRQGVPYASPALREQYRAPVRQAVAPRAIPEPARVAPARVAPEPARAAPQPARPAPETARPAPQTARPAPETARPAPETARPAPQPARPAPEPARPAPQPARPAPQPARAAPTPAQVAPAPTPERFGNREIPHPAPPSQSRSAFNGMQNGEASRTFAQHGYSSLGPTRSAAPAPAAPRAAPAASRPAPAPKPPAAAKPGDGPKR